MEDLIFEKLARLNARVDALVILEDLFLLDQQAEHDFRIPFLLSGLCRRHFLPSNAACLEAIALYDRIVELYSIREYADLLDFGQKFQAYLKTKDVPIQ